MSFGDMSVREKSAWITLVSVVVCFGVYYGAILAGLVASTSFEAFHLGLGCILAVIAVQVGFNLVATFVNPAEARTPRDEREQLIQSRSHTVGYYTLMFGVVVVVIATHLPVHGRSKMDIIVSTVNLGVLAMVVAAVAVAIAQILMFRRGA